MKPTRIVKIVEKGSFHKLFITCDDGKEYTVNELAQVIGLDRSGMHQRLRLLKFDDPAMLNPPAKRGYRIDGRNTFAKGYKSSQFQKLSSRVRSENLRKIRPLGMWEVKQ